MNEMTKSKHLMRRLSVATAAPQMFKVAFASSDLYSVNQHFGSTSRIAIYGMTYQQAMLLEVVDFSVQEGHDDDKLSSRIEAIKGCFSLYCVAIGDIAFQQLLRVGVRAVKVEADTPIKALLDYLQVHWDTKQVMRYHHKADRERFKKLQQSEWNSSD